MREEFEAWQARMKGTLGIQTGPHFEPMTRELYAKLAWQAALDALLKDNEDG